MEPYKLIPNFFFSKNQLKNFVVKLFFFRRTTFLQDSRFKKKNRDFGCVDIFLDLIKRKKGVFDV